MKIYENRRIRLCILLKSYGNNSLNFCADFHKLFSRGEIFLAGHRKIRYNISIKNTMAAGCRPD